MDALGDADRVLSESLVEDKLKNKNPRLDFLGASISSYLSIMAGAPRKDFNVAVVGGGMCGLAAAYSLARAGVTVDVFEAAVSGRSLH